MTHLPTLTAQDLRILAHEYATQRDARPDSWRALHAYADSVASAYTGAIGYVPHEPYDDADAQRADVLECGRLDVSTLHCAHAFWTASENVTFRVMHDLAHVAYGQNFSTRGEWQTFLHTLRHTPLAAQHALMCESIYQLAAAHVLGGFPTGVQRCTTLGPYASLLLRTHRS